MAYERVSAYLSAEGEVAKDVDLPAFSKGDKVVPYKIINHHKGEELEGLHYEQLMPWVKPTEKVDSNAAPFITNYAVSYTHLTLPTNGW